MPMAKRKIRSTAVLIGYNPDGKCVYSEILDLSDYYDGEHPWDKSASVKRLKLQRLKGYLFDAEGGARPGVREFLRSDNGNLREWLFPLRGRHAPRRQARRLTRLCQMDQSQAKPGADASRPKNSPVVSGSVSGISVRNTR